MYTYLMYDNIRYKIGKSDNPEGREKELKTANPNVKLLCYGKGDNESFLHNKYEHRRYAREWFDLTESDVKAIRLFLNTRQKVFRDVNTILDFGKFKGLKIADLVYENHINYMKWYLKQDNNNSFWAEMFRKQIDRIEKLNKKFKKK